MHPYHSLCGDFGIGASVNTRLELPAGRETVLHFFGALQRAFPDLCDFEKRETGEFCLEGDREAGPYRWVCLEPLRLAVGYANPPTPQDADAVLPRVLEIAEAHLDIAPLDCETLDLVYSFELGYGGNHDELVADALLAGSPLEGMLPMPGGRVLNYEPSLTFSLDDKCRLQCRLHVETRSGGAESVRSGRFDDVPVCVYFTVRQYWDRRPFKSFAESYQNQRRLSQELVDGYVIPNVVRPLAETIAARQ